MSNEKNKKHTHEPLPERLAHLGLPAKEYQQFIKKIKTRFPNKPYCAVQGWIWIDFDFPEDERYSKLSGSYIWASNIIEDEAMRFPVGGWVMSTPLATLHENCIFETRNTLYILVGPGRYWFREDRYDH